MNRSIKGRIAAFFASTIVTFGLVDAIAVYAYAPPVASSVVVASASH